MLAAHHALEQVPRLRRAALGVVPCLRRARGELPSLLACVAPDYLPALRGRVVAWLERWGPDDVVSVCAARSDLGPAIRVGTFDRVRCAVRVSVRAALGRRPGRASRGGYRAAGQGGGGMGVRRLVGVLVGGRAWRARAYACAARSVACRRRRGVRRREVVRPCGRPSWVTVGGWVAGSLAGSCATPLRVGGGLESPARAAVVVLVMLGEG